MAAMTKKKIVQFFMSVICIFLLEGCVCPYKLIPEDQPAPQEPFCVPENIRVALVLGSGGVRGIAHVGVIEELVSNGIPIDLIVGCSAGSIVGALYADNLDLAELKHDVWEMRTHSVLDIDIWNVRYGLSQGYCMHRVLDKYLEAERFDQLKIPLVVVTTDLHSGELVPIGSGDLVKAVQSSCSIPFVFVPCQFGGRICVDGGVIDPVPVKIARELGADVIICVDLCELLDRTFPTNLLSVANRSAEIAFMWQNEVCCRGASVVIRPKTCGVGAFNDEMKQQVYMAGKNAACEQMPLIKELVSKAVQETPTTGGRRMVCLDCYTPDIYRKDMVVADNEET